MYPPRETPARARIIKETKRNADAVGGFAIAAHRIAPNGHIHIKEDKKAGSKGGGGDRGVGGEKDKVEVEDGIRRCSLHGIKIRKFCPSLLF